MPFPVMGIATAHGKEQSHDDDRQEPVHDSGGVPEL
jgi:hypothetical protein